jgi:glycosyltransferase involved in cell wall biosynthesis
LNKLTVNSLVVTRQAVYPPVGGAPLRNWQNIELLSSIGRVCVFEIALGKQKPALTSLSGVDSYQRVNITQSNAKSLWGKLVGFIKSNSWLVNANAHPWTHNIYYNEQIAKSLEEFIKKHQPNIVIIEELWLINYLKVIRKFNCKVILDEHNVEGFLRQDLLLKNKKNLSFLSFYLERMKIKRLLQIEALAITNTDQTWVCGDNDADLIKKKYMSNANIAVIPNGIDVEDYELVRKGQYDLPPGLKKDDFILFFPATFGYPPNSEAAEYLIDTLLPLLEKQLKTFKIALVGKDPTPKMLALADNSNILITGAVDDMRPYWAAAVVVIVPLLQGGGTRLKIVEAFAAGKPVVSTLKGAEGIKAEHAEDIFLVDNAEDFVACIAKLQQDSNLRLNMANNALKIVNGNYSRKAVGLKIKENIESLLTRGNI